MCGFIPKGFVFAFVVGGAGVDGDVLGAGATVAVVFVDSEIHDACVVGAGKDDANGFGVPDSAFGCGDVFLVEVFADAFVGFAF